VSVIDYNTDISIKYGELSHYLQWCETNCKGKWSITIKEPAGSDPGSYNFSFENELDYMTFIIWKI
jgi:hypothetical protein